MLFGIAILIQLGLPTASGLQCQSVFFGKAVPAKTSPTQPCDEDLCSRTVEDAVPYAVNLFAVYNKGRSPCEISDGAIRVSYPVTDYDDGICKCLVGVLVRRMKQSGTLKDAHGNEVKCDFESLAEHLKQIGDGPSVTEVRRGNSCHCKSRGGDCVEDGKTGRPVGDCDYNPEQLALQDPHGDPPSLGTV
jgi:hypothetical protein